MDIFAGRVYERQPSPATNTYRKMLSRTRDYDNTDLYSIPIDSRYHPERAPLWRPDSLVPGKEQWIFD